MSSSTPFSMAISSATSASTVLLIVNSALVRSFSLKSSSAAFMPIASDSERTVIGRLIGTLPLRSTVPLGWRRDFLRSAARGPRREPNVSSTRVDLAALDDDVA